MTDTVAADMLKSWRRARLAHGGEHLGYPTENILAKAGMARTGRPPPLPSGEKTDAEIVQDIVDTLMPEVKSAFEAMFLGIIRGERCRDIPHAARANVLGIDKSTYWYRVHAAEKIIAEKIGEWFDRLDRCG